MILQYAMFVLKHGIKKSSIIIDLVPVGLISKGQVRPLNDNVVKYWLSMQCTTTTGTTTTTTTTATTATAVVTTAVIIKGRFPQKCPVYILHVLVMLSA